MKIWPKVMLVAVACVLCYAAGHYYTGGSYLQIRPLLTCIGILLVTWMQL